MKLIIFLWKEAPAKVVLFVFFACIAAISNAGLLSVISRAINNFDSMSGNDLRFYAVFAALTLLGQIFAKTFSITIAQKAISDIRKSISLQILSTPLDAFQKMKSAKLFGTLTEDITTISQAVPGVAYVSVHIITVIACAFLLGTLSVLGTICIAIYVIMAVAVYQIPAIIGRRFFSHGRGINDRLFINFHGLLEGQKELRQDNKLRHAFWHRYLETIDASENMNKKAYITFLAADSWGYLLFFILIGLLVGGAFRFAFIDANLTKTAIVITLFLITPFADTMKWVPLLARANSALGNINKLGLSLRGLGNLQLQPLPGIKLEYQDLQLKNCIYDYSNTQEKEFILGPLDFDLKCGEIVYIAGGNGSGKSTFMKVLSGVLQPTSGSISVNNKIYIDSTNADLYRSLFTVIFSDFFLFDNIGFEGSKERIDFYKSLLNLNEKVSIQDGGVSTIDLSQGQKRRLAMIRALLQDRPIFIFDEWAADQEPAFRSIFYQELLPALKAQGKSVVVITHDEKYFHLADRLIKFENGRLLNNS